MPQDDIRNTSQSHIDHNQHHAVSGGNTKRAPSTHPITQHPTHTQHTPRIANHILMTARFPAQRRRWFFFSVCVCVSDPRPALTSTSTTQSDTKELTTRSGSGCETQPADIDALALIIAFSPPAQLCWHQPLHRLWSVGRVDGRQRAGDEWTVNFGSDTGYHISYMWWSTYELKWEMRTRYREFLFVVNLLGCIRIYAFSVVVGVLFFCCCYFRVLCRQFLFFAWYAS